MTIIAFLLGLLIGFTVHLVKQRQEEKRLKQILITLANPGEQINSLSITSQIRREIIRLRTIAEEQNQDLQVWEKLLAQAPFGYLKLDQYNHLVDCNTKAQHLLQITEWQPDQGRLLLELVRSYELDQLIQKTRESQEIQTVAWEFYQKASATAVPTPVIHLKAYGYPLRRGVVVVFLESLQALVEASRSQERAFSDLTHELRTPLTSIALVTELLEKRLSPPEKGWVEQMSKETNRLIKLVQDWLEVSQITVSSVESSGYQSLEVESLVTASWRTLEPLAQQKQLTLNYQQELRSAVVRGDRSRLTQVFLNLLDNSIKYSPPGAEILVIVTPVLPRWEESYLKIDLIDSGPGFNEADLPYVFERLYRGDSSRTRQSDWGGNGLGLAIVKQIVQVHGGKVSAKNSPKTGGAWLQLIFPSL